MGATMQLAIFSNKFKESPPKNRADFLEEMRQLETILEDYIDAHSGDNINQRDENGGPLQGADDGCGPFREKLAEVRGILRDA